MNLLLQPSRVVPRAGTYALHTDHCAVTLSVRHLVARSVRAQVSPLGGELVLEDDPTSTRVWIDLDAASLTTGHPERDAVLHGPDLLDVDRFPFIRFESREVVRMGAERYGVNGDLYLRDLVGPVELDVRVLPTRPGRIACVATASLRRSMFELRWDERVERLGVVVGDTVRVQMGAEFGAVDGGWAR